MNVLLLLENNLASSIALRYLCRQSKIIPMTIQPIYVQEPEQRHYALGAGWVRHTWEKAIITTSETEINNFIQSEAEYCRGLVKVKVVIGDRAKEILKELETGFYDLYAEGMLTTFDVTSFYNLLKSRPIKRTTCPILLVKNLVPFDSVSILLDHSIDINRLINLYLKLYSQVSVRIDLIAYLSQEPGVILQEVEEGPEYVERAKELLRASGCKQIKTLVAQGRPQDVAEKLKKVGMVTTIFDKNRTRRSPLIDIIAYTLSPVLIFWY